MFSVASIWEVAIEQKLARLDKRLHPGRLRRVLLENDYEEVPISGPHAISAGLLPAVQRIHSTGFWSRNPPWKARSC